MADKKITVREHVRTVKSTSKNKTIGSDPAKGGAPYTGQSTPNPRPTGTKIIGGGGGKDFDKPKEGVNVLRGR